MTTSLADADSLRYYPAYEAAPLDGLPAQSPVPPSTTSSCSSCSGRTAG